MNKRILPIFFVILLLFSFCFSACNANQRIFGSASDTTPEQSIEETIRRLEMQIALLKQSQDASDAENQKELVRLQNLLASLKEEASSSEESSSTDQQQTEGETVADGKFLYVQEGANAVITGYTGQDETLVIPSKIDGLPVTAIGDNAFQSKHLKTVVVADGITKIGWFAFRDCPALVSVTLPSSVTVIGYSAFSSDSTALTIYCHRNSFAQKYVESYGIRHAII